MLTAVAETINNTAIWIFSSLVCLFVCFLVVCSYICFIHRGNTFARSVGCLVWRKFNNELYMQTFQDNSFIPAMLVGAIDLSHLKPLLVTLTADHKIAESKTCLVHFFHTPQLIRIGFVRAWKQFKLNILIPLSVKYFIIKGNSLCWILCQKAD